MRRAILISVCLPLLNAAGFARDGSSGAAKILAHSWGKLEFRLPISRQVKNETVLSFQETVPPSSDTKSVAKAVLFSAVLPGSGQFYNGSILKSIAFLMIEAGAIYGHIHFQNRGNDLENRFEADADRLWDEDAYWDWISIISGIDRANMDGLRAYEHDNFSHFLPEQKSQQYYENIGKYDQFVVGWQDFREQTLNGNLANLRYEDYLRGSYNDQDLTTISPYRNAYVNLRADANRNFKRATTMITAVIFNHVVSALDAGWSAKRHNQKILKANLKMGGFWYGQEFVPSFGVGVAW
jgi:hypothetical protein